MAFEMVQFFYFVADLFTRTVDVVHGETEFLSALCGRPLIGHGEAGPFLGHKVRVVAFQGLAWNQCNAFFKYPAYLRECPRKGTALL